jgi:hypothetical protein
VNSWISSEALSKNEGEMNTFQKKENLGEFSTSELAL